MATVSDLITDAFAEIGVFEAGEAIPAEDQARALRRLNQILSALSNSPLSIWVLTELSIVLTTAQSYTIGPTGDVVASRPIAIKGATCVDASGLETPIEIVTRRQWDTIYQKDITGGPVAYVWHEATFPNATVRVYPKAPGYTLRLDAQMPLTAFSGVLQDVSLPEGYEPMLTLMLAESLAPSYSATLSPLSLKRLNGIKAGIRRVNAEPLILGNERPDEYMIERGY